MQNSFEPHELAFLARVVDEACHKPGCDESARAVVAARVLSFAARGTADYKTLLAVATFERDRLKLVA